MSDKPFHPVTPCRDCPLLYYENDGCPYCKLDYVNLSYRTANGCCIDAATDCDLKRIEYGDTVFLKPEPVMARRW